MTLEFDEALHEYRWDGMVIPGVTDVIEAVGLSDSRWYPPEAAERGQYVHVLCAMDDRGDLTDELLAQWPEYAGYVESWRAWRTMARPRFTEIEQRGTGEVNGIRYGLTVDRRGFTYMERRAVWDLKSGAPTPGHAIQLAAYHWAQQWPHERYGVYLQADGSPAQVRRFSDPNDVAKFAAALLLYGDVKKCQKL